MAAGRNGQQFTSREISCAEITVKRRAISQYTRWRRQKRQCHSSRNAWRLNSAMVREYLKSSQKPKRLTKLSSKHLMHLYEIGEMGVELQTIGMSDMRNLHTAESRL